jgi:HEPN domain-containing protein
VTRGDFQKLADERIADAEALLQAGRFGGVYYFSGLAVECALKARIASRTKEHDFPDLRRAQSSHQHDLERLVEVAELKSILDQHMDANPKFRVNWNTVKQWQIETRYDPSVTQSKAQELFSSATKIAREYSHGYAPSGRAVKHRSTCTDRTLSREARCPGNRAFLDPTG